MTGGHRFFMAALAQVSDDQLSAPSALPGWTGRHILSHVGHNARAVGRLAYWAATGVPTPMYPGPTARAEEIALGAQWDAECPLANNLARQVRLRRMQRDQAPGLYGSVIRARALSTGVVAIRGLLSTVADGEFRGTGASG